LIFHFFQNVTKVISLTLCLTLAACASQHADSAFAPQMSLSAGALDKTHEENFPMPGEDKDNFDEKSGTVIWGILGGAALVGAAILIPLFVTDKL
jgi:hypothetical protein